MSTHGKAAPWFRSNADVHGIFLACFRFSLNQVSPPQQPIRIINRRGQRSRHADADLAPAYDRDEMNARASGAGSSTWQIGHLRHRGCAGLCCSRKSQHRDFDALWQLVNVYCNVVVTKRVWRDAVPTYFVSLVSREVDLKACAELMAGCRDVAPTEQSLDSAVRSIGHEAQERSSSLIQRNF